MMFICNECGETFPEPAITHDSVPYGEEYIDGPTQASCPYCHGNFETAKKCELCGEWCISELKDNNVCHSCLGELKKRLEPLMAENFSESEKNILTALFEEGGYSEY